MDEAFDPYYVWLGIPPHEQPPNHYRLLGVALFEPRSDVIQVAAQKQIAHVKSFALSDFADVARRLLMELTQAKLCLLNASKRAEYDARLRSQLGTAAVGTAAPAVSGAPSSSGSGMAAGHAGLDAATMPPRPAIPPGSTGRHAVAGHAARPGQSPADAARPGQSRADAARSPVRIWIVGADRDCDVVVPDPPVSARHCRLIQTEEGLFIEDLSSTNGTYVDGRRIEGRTPVTTASRVTLGRRVPLPWPREILYAEGKALGTVLRIGAAPDNDMVIDLPMISGHHARLVVETDGVYIEDLGSTNGTGLGSPVNRIHRARLEPTDTVYLGSYPVPATRLLERLGVVKK